MTVKKHFGGCYEDKKPVSTLSAMLIQESSSIEKDFGKVWTIIRLSRGIDGVTVGSK